MQRFLISALVSFSILAVMLAPAYAGKPDGLDLKLTQGTNIAIAVAPAGQSLVFDLQGTLWRMPVAGGKATAITDEFGDARQPAFSPDGKLIAFQSYRDGTWHIWTVAPDGSQLTQVTTGAFDDREPHWSPDGKSLVFCSDRAGNYDVWKIVLATRSLQQLTRDQANDYNPAWSPDGSQIAFVSERVEGRGVWLLTDVNNPEKRREVLFNESSLSLSAPSWSPDGAHIAFQSSDRSKGATGLWAKATAGQQQPRLLSAAGEDVFPFRAAWVSKTECLYTSDGVIKRTGIEKAGIESGPLGTISFEATVTLARPVYARKKRDFDSLAPRRARGVVAPAVSPDGRRIAFTALGDLWVQEQGKKALQVTDDLFVEAYPRWSPDGTKLVYVSDRQGEMDVWTRDLKTGDERLVAKSAGASFPAWSLDGSRIAFFGGDAGNPLGGRLQILDLESGKIRTVLNRTIPPGQISWGPGGKSLAVAALNPYSTRYREGVFALLVVPLDGGDPSRIIPVANRSLSYAAWSPDGKLIAFVEDGRLSVAPVNEKGEITGPARRLGPDLADWPSWSGDSKTIVYLSTDRLKKVNVQTGRSEEISLLLDWQPEKVAGEMVVHAGRLFDGKSADYLRDIDLVIEGSRIKDILPHSDVLHKGRVIDASDKTVIPGLFEMHGHQGIVGGERQGRIWLAFGVTSVREPGTDPYEALESRESWASGRRPGPREFFCGRLFDGARVYYGIAEGLASDDHIELALERARRLDFDLIKTYVRLPDAAQKRILAAAHQMGIPTSSHEIYPAAAYGMDAMEHTGATSRRGYSPKVTALGRSYDDVVQILARSQMNYTPTLILSGIPVVLAENPDLLKNKQFISLYGEQAAQGLAARVTTAGRNAALRDSFAALRKTVSSVLRAGGRVTAGTDSPLVPYGFALQLEIQALVQAGFTPFEALRSATLWSAEAIGVGRDLGSIERGKLADLVIVEGDPLQKIEDTLRVAVTIKNGKPYAIDDLLKTPR
jgi:Tol biopolymer transport system component/imidazolonepropionase-like amidohydrolase